MRTLTCLLCILVSVAWAANGAGETSPTPTEIADASKAANEFFERAFDERLARQPMFQTQLGIKDRYGEWDDLSDEAAKENLALVETQLAELQEKIDYERLDPTTRVSYDLFVADAQREMEAFQYRFYTYPVNQMFGWQSRVPAFLISYHKIDSVDDAEAYIERLRRVQPLFDQLIAKLQECAERGIIAPRFVFDYVLDDSRNVITGAPFDLSAEPSTILEDFQTKVEALELKAADQRLLVEKTNKALVDNVKPAYEKLIAYLSQLREQATTDDGAWKFPDGEAYYRQRLRHITTTSYTADEIHDIGLREVARIHGEMKEIMDEVGFEGSLQDFFTFLREADRFYFDETEEGRQAYLTRAAEIIDGMKARLDDLFTVKPKADIVVKRVEPFREKSAGKAFYQRPSLDGTRPGTYYANLYRMSEMPTYQMEALAYHEGIPGHHMQLAIAIEMENLPRFRRYLRFTAYTEGWGLYSEYIPKEIGFYEDPYSDFGRLAMELWRACRLVVDTGIHAKKWTRQQATDYLAENTPNPHGDCVKAIDRYIVMPGQATAYKIGMIRILELREEARERLGDRFDIREFHDLVLENGPVPLDVFEALVDSWVESKMSS